MTQFSQLYRSGTKIISYNISSMSTNFSKEWVAQLSVVVVEEAARDSAGEKQRGNVCWTRTQKGQGQVERDQGATRWK